jgi:ubiquinone/menaquinone biosynthesis C-methylase UbiE
MINSSLINVIPKSYTQDVDGIYCTDYIPNNDQPEEIALRLKVAEEHGDDYFHSISLNHSIPVMDFEVDRFLKKIPYGGIILDVGGCWGWHWRRLIKNRPDVSIVIIDFVKANLLHAKKLLVGLHQDKTALLHADATSLPFILNERFYGFDGVWSVQTFQHIPSFEKAINEVFRVLRPGGYFINYSLNYQPHIGWIKRLFGKRYLKSGFIENSFWLARASDEQKEKIEFIFSCQSTDRWTEILFSPELHFTSPGKQQSFLGYLDRLLSNNDGFLSWLARQRSFECEKPE